MSNQHTRKARPEASNTEAWTVRWEGASRDRRRTTQQLAAVAAMIALLLLVFAGAAGEQPPSEAPAGHVPPAAFQPGTAIPAGAPVQLTGDTTDLVSWLEQSQASAAGPLPAAADPTDLVHWLEQFEQTR